jgi:hypothetical protein
MRFSWLYSPSDWCASRCTDGSHTAWTPFGSEPSLDGWFLFVVDWLRATTVWSNLLAIPSKRKMIEKFTCIGSWNSIPGRRSGLTANKQKAFVKNRAVARQVGACSAACAGSDCSPSSQGLRTRFSSPCHFMFKQTTSEDVGCKMACQGRSDGFTARRAWTEGFPKMVRRPAC